MTNNKNKIAQQIFGVNYNQLGKFGKWEVDDKLKELKFLSLGKNLLNQPINK